MGPLRTLRVLTLNLWGHEGDVARRMAAARAAIQRLAVDVLALQEVRSPAPSAQAIDQAAYFAEVLGGTVHFVAVDPTSTDGPIGNAIISRLPARTLGSVHLPSPPGDPRAALAVEITTSVGTLALITTHLSWELDAAPIRERQVVAVDRFARIHRRDLPSILTGDFNASPDSDAIRFLTGRTALEGCGAYWRDTFSRIHPHDDGYTWSARNPLVVRHVERNRRIDFIFVAPMGRDGRGAVLDARVALDQPGESGVYPSDHFAVFAEIALEPIDELL